MCLALVLMERSGVCLCLPCLQKPPDSHSRWRAERSKSHKKHSGSMFVRVLSLLECLRAWAVGSDQGSTPFSFICQPCKLRPVPSPLQSPHLWGRKNGSSSEGLERTELEQCRPLLLLLLFGLWSILPFCPRHPHAWHGAGAQLWPRLLVSFQLP